MDIFKYIGFQNLGVELMSYRVFVCLIFKNLLGVIKSSWTIFAAYTRVLVTPHTFTYLGCQSLMSAIQKCI